MVEKPWVWRGPSGRWYVSRGRGWRMFSTIGQWWGYDTWGEAHERAFKAAMGEPTG